MSKYFTLFLISVLCIIEMVITKESPNLGWLFIAYGCYKIFKMDIGHYD
jgi:hypothetical protein